MTTSSSPLSPMEFPNFHPTPGAPPSYDPQRQAWQVFRYAEVERVLSDFTTFSSKKGKLDPQDRGRNSGSIGDLDPPRHRQLRSLVTQAFTPRMVASLEPRIIHLAHELLDAVVDRGEMDLISDFAIPLPMRIIAEIVGVPDSDLPLLRQWSLLSGSIITPEAVQARNATIDYFEELVQQRQKVPASDLISTLLSTEADGDHLALSEVINFCRTLFAAGNETTRNLIGNAMVCFDRHPEALAQVLAEPDLLPSALEEVLRYLPPVLAFPRVAVVDTVVGEQEIKAGQWVTAHMDAANRDETSFADPNTFDIRRHPNPHMAFSHGIHFCLGAPLARLEAKIALEVLFERCSEIKLVPGVALEAIINPLGYGIKRVPITFRRR